MSEHPFDLKRERILRFLTDLGYEALVIGGPRNFAWLTGGHSNVVDRTASLGVAVVKITARYVKLITTNIEAPRMRDEVVGDLPIEIVGVPWHESDALAAEIRRDPRRLRLAGDVTIPGTGIAQMARPFWTLQSPLLAEEIERYRALGRDASAAVEGACRALEPGHTELDVAADVTRRLLEQDMWPAVLLVGADARREKFRHPVPTSKTLERSCMIAVCAERGGLVANLTRTVNFGPVPGDMAARHTAVAGINAALVAASQPRAVLGDVFRVGIDAYASAGFPDEWQGHHQGGTTGYNTREVVATPESAETLMAGQAVTWNPSVPGAKSEDTYLVTADGPELLTPTTDWPLLDVEGAGAVAARPGILVR